MSQSVAQDEIDLGLEEGEEATDYAVDVSIPHNEMRVQFRDADGAIAFHIFAAAEAYTFAQKILRGYDRLEGL